MSASSSPAQSPDLLVVGANPAIDVYYCLDRLHVGDVNRVAAVRVAAGGKGNNLARAYQRLGGHPLAVGIVGGETGRRILAGLTDEGIAHDVVSTDGESRQTVTVVAGGTTTVLLEPGPSVSEAALDFLAAKVIDRAHAVPVVAIVGSLPPGSPPGYVAGLVRRVREATGAWVAVDTSGEALRLGGLAGPHLIKVNAEEFEGAFQQPALDRTGVERIFGQLADVGVELLCLTAGVRGALVVTERERFVVRSNAGETVSTAGAGDAFLAGLLVARRRGDGPREAARFAAAAAAAALQTIGAGFIDRAAVAPCLARVQVLDAEEFFVERRP